MSEKPTTPDPLDALASEAQTELGADDPLAPGADHGAQAEQGAQPALTNEQALAGALAAGREAFCAFTKLKSPKATLNDDAIQQAAGLWGPVLTKHGINLGSYLGDYALEFAAIIGSISIVAAVRAGVSAELAELRKKQPAEGATLDAPDSRDPAAAE